MPSYVDAADRNIGNKITDIVLQNLLEVNPTQAWNDNEQDILNIVAFSEVNDVNVQEKLMCGYSVTIGTIVAGNRPALNTSDYSSMEL